MYYKTDPNDYITIFKSIADGILLEGSHSWGGNTDNSDVDLEIITPDFSDIREALRDVPHLKFVQNVNRCLDAIKERKELFDIIQTKVSIGDTTTSARLIELETFTRISHLDFVSLEKPIYLNSIRESQRAGQSEFYRQRNFSGETP